MSISYPYLILFLIFFVQEQFYFNASLDLGKTIRLRLVFVQNLTGIFSSTF